VPAPPRDAPPRPALAAESPPLVGSGAAKGGWLTLDTTPWTQVYEGKRLLGDTPLANVALPAGAHQLRLTNPDQNVSQTVEVVIESNKTTVTKLEF
jgi:serine/threonine-protein kinase